VVADAGADAGADGMAKSRAPPLEPPSSDASPTAPSRAAPQRTGEAAADVRDGGGTDTPGGGEAGAGDEAGEVEDDSTATEQEEEKEEKKEKSPLAPNAAAETAVDGTGRKKKKERYAQEILDYEEIFYPGDGDEISSGMGTSDLATKKKVLSIPKTDGRERYNQGMVDYSDKLSDSDRDNSDASSHRDDDTEEICFICNEGGGKRCVFLYFRICRFNLFLF
jgi:hypothetical protein